MKTCATCGEVLLAPKGRQRFCSERCRKRQYDLVCVVCGGRVDGTTPSKMSDRDRPVCSACAPSHYAAFSDDAILSVFGRLAARNHGEAPSCRMWDAEHIRDPSSVCGVSEIIRRFGTWNAAVEAAGLTPWPSGVHSRYPRWSAEDRARCVDRYAAGESSIRIAADVGCAAPTIVKWVRAAGVEVRPGAFGGRR